MLFSMFTYFKITVLCKRKDTQVGVKMKLSSNKNCVSVFNYCDSFQTFKKSEASNFQMKVLELQTVKQIKI